MLWSAAWHVAWHAQWTAGAAPLQARPPVWGQTTRPCLEHTLVLAILGLALGSPCLLARIRLGTLLPLVCVGLHRQGAAEMAAPR